MTALTLQEAKDQIAKSKGFIDRYDMGARANWMEKDANEAAELYCQSQKAQAWEQGFEEGYNYRSARSPESVKALGEPTKPVNFYLIETKKD